MGRADTKEGCVLIDKILPEHERVRSVVVDEGYRGSFVDHVERKWKRKVEISKGVKEEGFTVIAKRWVVERSFAWLNAYRVLSKEYEKTVSVAETMLQIACIRKTLKGALF